MKVDIIAATKADVEAVARNMTDRHRAEWAALLPDGYDTVEVLTGRFVGGVCARVGGDPVAVGEVFVARPGVASLGLVTTDAFPVATLAFTKFLRNGLFRKLEAEGTHRIECMTLAQFAAARRWMGLLGLQEEATLRCYGRNKEDFVQFARVKA